MSWDTLADLALKAGINTFKTTGTYTRAADPGNPISLRGVFDKVNQVVDAETGAQVDSLQPTFGIRLADLPAAPAKGDTLLIKGQLYNVDYSQEDGEGGSALVLTEAT
jgi:hypothetical protein